MKYVIGAVYDDYISANLAQGLLESENINCWLKDELSVTVQPFLTNGLNGIKLMVAEPQLERALRILQTTKQQFNQQHACPQCGSTNIEYVSTPKKVSNVLGALFGAMFLGSGLQFEKKYHCFDCGHEYESP